ncbi:hypothetical protein [Allosphingosinicella deserti]|uniref:Sulfotransferase domain-containing protein n=1 Tax=Allosphingosinicella deserti TaxID=2116704 RepID=A0A2P7QE93_9SPHN|nr:hypothetical protein [Sphingomonas deserti]PSJ36264.1 hypothetical protein C7I55_27145 [Sphingomonas deserti]
MQQGLSCPEGATICHLVHVGYPKTGSSFLKRWFRTHPQIGFFHAGFAGYRNPDEIALDASEAAPQVLCRVTSSENLATPTRHAGVASLIGGPALSGSSAKVQQLACDRVADLFPGATILIVTRAIASLVPSLYSQYVKSGGASSLTAFCDEMAALLGADESPWDYDRFITCYRRKFGAENVIVMPFELLRDDPVRFTTSLEKRLRLGRHVPQPTKVNPALSAVEQAWYPRITRRVTGLPRPIGRAILKPYFRAIRSGRLALLAHVLQRLKPLALNADRDAIGKVVEAWRGRAALLAAEPLFHPYAHEYCLHDGAPAICRSAE